FVSVSLSCFVGFGADSVGSLLCFLPAGFGRLLRFLACGFQSILNCLPCLLRVLLYCLTYPFLPKNGQHSGCNQRDDQTRDSHVFLLLLTYAYLRFESGSVVVRTNDNLRRLKLAVIDYPGLSSARLGTQHAR